MGRGDVVRRIARRIWRVLPAGIRGALFRTFLRSVRNRRLIAEVEGVLFELDLGEMIDAGIYLGSFERDVARAIRQTCRPGWCVVDVGANIGAHTLPMSRLVGPSGKVLAFEPTEYAFRKLSRNLSLNPAENVTAVRGALSDRNITDLRMRVRASWRTNGRETLEETTVSCWRLDDWCAKEGVSRIDLVKVDVDGEECAVLRGGEKLIAKSRPIVILEVGAWHFEAPEANPLAFLAEKGYRFWALEDLKPLPNEEAIRSRLPAHDPGKTISVNVLAAADGAPLSLLAEENTGSSS